jgi:hypothetical protein
MENFTDEVERLSDTPKTEGALGSNYEIVP